MEKLTVNNKTIEMSRRVVSKRHLLMINKTKTDNVKTVKLSR
jgi:hypothetical protein